MIAFEWSVEVVTAIETVQHEENEVLDISHFDTYAEARAYAAGDPGEGMRFDVALVRTTERGDRSWAYIDDAGKLPSHFEDAYQKPVAIVPARFVAEVNKSQGEQE
jgi:hypothetical protein